jgi:hypothetical protein
VDTALIQAGIIEPQEARQRIAADPDTPYVDLDPMKAIAPPQQDGEEGEPRAKSTDDHWGAVVKGLGASGGVARSDGTKSSPSHWPQIQIVSDPIQIELFGEVDTDIKPHIEVQRAERAPHARKRVLPNIACAVCVMLTAPTLTELPAGVEREAIGRFDRAGRHADCDRPLEKWTRRFPIMGPVWVLLDCETPAENAARVIQKLRVSQ